MQHIHPVHHHSSALLNKRRSLFPARLQSMIPKDMAINIRNEVTIQLLCRLINLEIQIIIDAQTHCAQRVLDYFDEMPSFTVMLNRSGEIGRY